MNANSQKLYLPKHPSENNFQQMGMLGMDSSKPVIATKVNGRKLEEIFYRQDRYAIATKVLDHSSFDRGAYIHPDKDYYQVTPTMAVEEVAFEEFFKPVDTSEFVAIEYDYYEGFSLRFYKGEEDILANEFQGSEIYKIEPFKIVEHGAEHKTLEPDPLNESRGRA